MARLRIEAQHTYEQFAAEWTRLVEWHGMGARMKREHSRSVYARLKSFPIRAVATAVDRLTASRKPVQSAWPTVDEIANECWQYLRDNPSLMHAMMEYDPDEDWDYPLRNLWQGVGVLKERGEQGFRAWATKMRMPRQDQERVRNKARAIHRVEDLAENVGNRIGGGKQKQRSR